MCYNSDAAKFIILILSKRLYVEIGLQPIEGNISSSFLLYSHYVLPSAYNIWMSPVWISTTVYLSIYLPCLHYHVSIFLIPRALFMFLTIFDVKRVCMKATFRVYLLCQQYYSNCYTANGIIFIFVFCFVLRKEYYGDQILGREGSAEALVDNIIACRSRRAPCKYSKSNCTNTL